MFTESNNSKFFAAMMVLSLIVICLTFTSVYAIYAYNGGLYVR